MGSGRAALLVVLAALPSQQAARAETMPSPKRWRLRQRRGIGRRGIWRAGKCGGVGREKRRREKRAVGGGRRLAVNERREEEREEG